MSSIVTRSREFIHQCNTGEPGEYTFYPGGLVSLYASCYAAMAYHYIGDLQNIAEGERTAWIHYLQSWQDADSGYFLGPEIAPNEFSRPEMDETYVKQHLTIHALPTLELLGGTPAYPLRFAHPFTDPNYLLDWLNSRDLTHAWHEGNRLLCVGQILVFLRDKEKCAAAQTALDVYFDWLDAHQDPNTGLWGTDGHCDAYEALYGGAHQLLVYHSCGRPLKYPDRIIDTVLRLQHPDGSFSRLPGGGSCEDVDAIDTLVDLVVRTHYRIADVRNALHLALAHICRQQNTDGGFVYRWGQSYMQNGMIRTFVPSNKSEIFSTWYRLHTLALIDQIVIDPRLQGVPWGFNRSCSMGWHEPIELSEPGGQSDPSLKLTPLQKSPKESSARQTVGNLFRLLLSKFPANWGLKLFKIVLPRYARALPLNERIGFLLGLDSITDGLGDECAYEIAGGLHVRFWESQLYQFFLDELSDASSVLHLGCGEGSLSYTLATLTKADVIATDRLDANVQIARSRYHHRRLSFIPYGETGLMNYPADVIVFTDLDHGQPAWKPWHHLISAYDTLPVLAQLTKAPVDWRGLQDSVPQNKGMFDPIKINQNLPENACVIDIKTQWGTVLAKFRQQNRENAGNLEKLNSITQR